MVLCFDQKITRFLKPLRKQLGNYSYGSRLEALLLQHVEIDCGIEIWHTKLTYHPNNLRT